MHTTNVNDYGVPAEPEGLERVAARTISPWRLEGRRGRWELLPSFPSLSPNLTPNRSFNDSWDLLPESFPDYALAFFSNLGPNLFLFLH